MEEAQNDLYVPYSPPEGFYDVPFYWVFDASGLVDGQNALNQAIQIQRGFGDFVLRRMVGILGCINPGSGQFQIRDAGRSYHQTTPEYAAMNDDYPFLPESVYPELTQIAFDLYDVLRADPPITGTYTQTGQLTPSIGRNTYEGVAVSGSLLVVGTPDETNVTAGAFLIYELVDGDWVLTQTITGPTPGIQFGASVATDGTTIAVGAPGTQGSGANGQVFTYTKVDGTWTQQQVLTSSNETEGPDFFGQSVQVAADVLMIGAPQASNSGSNTGAVYYFAFADSTWTQTQELFASVPENGAGFGQSVSMNGTKILIGAPYNTFGDDLGRKAYFFTLGGGTWTQTQVVAQADADQFGFAVYLPSATTAFIAQATDIGSVWVYTLISSTWTEKVNLTFGTSGDYGVCGTDDDLFATAGAGGSVASIYHFQLQSGTWTLTQTINSAPISAMVQIAIDADNNIYALAPDISPG